jgi:hypothetical protein
MPLTLDATVGGVSSNSYLTLLRADELAEQLPHASEWFTNEALDKPQLLVHATRLIDRYGYYYGSKTSPAQALQFPRTGLTYHTELTSVASNVIPNFIEWACIEWAFSLVTSEEATPASYGISSLSTPSFSLSFDSGAASSNDRPSVVDELLKPYARRLAMGFSRVLRT